jgi:hypothetical protein
VFDDSADVEIRNVTANSNADYGVRLSSVGDVRLANVTANDNGFGTDLILDPGSGVFTTGASAVRVQRGEFSRDADDGIHIEDALS